MRMCNVIGQDDSDYCEFRAPDNLQDNFFNVAWIQDIIIIMAICLS